MAREGHTSAPARTMRGMLGPAWRRRLVERSFDDPTCLRPLRDAVVQRLRAYLQVSMRDEGRRALSDPDLAAVEQLRQQPAVTARLQLATLGQLSVDAISARTGAAPAVVTLWQAVDFDIAGLEEATGWLLTHVVDPQPSATIAEQMRLVIAVGPAGAEAVLDALDGLPIDEAARLFEQRVALDLKLRAALKLACDTPARAQRFAGRFITWQQAEAELNLRREALALEVTQVQQRHEIALGELKRATAREQAQAAADGLANTRAQIRLEELRQRTHALQAAARVPRSAETVPHAATRQQAISPKQRPQQGAA